jgi:hypothetical protein
VKAQKQVWVYRHFTREVGSAVVEAVTSFPPQLPGFKTKSGHVGFVVDKVALGQVFSKYTGFSCQSLHQVFHTHQHFSTAGTIGQTVADVPSGLSHTQP